jgi:ParB family chromosome partitioning protein
MKAPDKPPRLGRGLASLLGSAAVAAPEAAATPAAESGIREIPVGLLEPGPYQPRGPIDPASLGELAASISARGVLQPLLARPHPDDAARYQIIAGERRWRAAQQAGLAEVPCLVRKLTDQEAAAAALVENLQREDLNPIEEAAGFARLRLEFGMTQEDLATAVGKSRSHVANTLRLLNLPQPVQDALGSGNISAGHARALLMHPKPEEALRRVLAQGLNVRQTEALVAAPDPAKMPRKVVEPDPIVVNLERDLVDRLGLRVEIRHGKRGGAITLHYTTLDQLDDLLVKLRA